MSCPIVSCPLPSGPVLYQVNDGTIKALSCVVFFFFFFKSPPLCIHLQAASHLSPLQPSQTRSGHPWSTVSLCTDLQSWPHWPLCVINLFAWAMYSCFLLYLLFPPHPSVPSCHQPNISLVLLKVSSKVFSCQCFYEGLALGFCKAPRDDFLSFWVSRKRFPIALSEEKHHTYCIHFS